MTEEPQAEAGRGELMLRGVGFAVALAEALLRFAGAFVVRGGGLRARTESAAGVALAQLCERLGATFIKVGQIASTRGDLLPRGVVDELSRLRDQVPAFSFAEVRREVERELGAPLESLFEVFDEEPVAAASVAQVHRARLWEAGEDVAVKVRRPDVLAKAHLDRRILTAFARGMERLVPTLRLVAIEGAITTFCDSAIEQIHLRNEAENNRRFQENFREDPDIHFPELHPELCTDRVIVMEFIDGVHERDLEGSEVEIRAVVGAGMRAVCRMIFSHGLVHADLHPGNMRFRPPGEVVLLDLGLVGRLADVDRMNTARMLFAFATGNGPDVAKVLFEGSPHTATADYDTYARDVQVFVEGLVSQGMANVQLTLEIGRLFDILRRHKVQARAHMTMVNLALMTAEGLGKRLAPDLSLTDEALPYLAEALGVPAPPAPSLPREAEGPGLA